MEAQTATTAERCGDRVEDSGGPAAPGRREARGQGRSEVQGPVQGRMGRGLLFPSWARSCKEISLGLQELGIERGDKVGILVEHEAGVDLLRLRHPRRRRHRRADLPDELARGMPLRARPLRVRAR